MSSHVCRLRWTGGLQAVLALLVLLSSTSILGAQTGRATAALEGTVLDPDTKAVVNAAVVVRSETTGSIVTTTTDGSGRFSIASLPQGAYAVEVFVPGFETVRRNGVQVSEGTPVSLSIQLSVANISETVTVSAALPAAAVAAPSQASLTGLTVSGVLVVSIRST